MDTHLLKIIVNAPLATAVEVVEAATETIIGAATTAVGRVLDAELGETGVDLLVLPLTPTLHLLALALVVGMLVAAAAARLRALGAVVGLDVDVVAAAAAIAAVLVTEALAGAGPTARRSISAPPHRGTAEKDRRAEVSTWTFRRHGIKSLIRTTSTLRRM